MDDLDKLVIKQMENHKFRRAMENSELDYRIARIIIKTKNAKYLEMVQTGLEQMKAGTGQAHDLVEAWMQLMPRNQIIFRGYVTGPYIQYISQGA